MSIIEASLTIVLNIIPILILIIPYFFIRKRLVGKIFLRIYLGVLIFYVIYWFLPIIFQTNITPENLEDPTNNQGFTFLAAHFGSLISLFAFYPLVTLPFIFFVAPFISILYVWNRLRKEEGSTQSNLKMLTYHFTESPIKRIRREIIRNDWSREKEILKLLIVLLPISLYLLRVILSVSGLETNPVITGETALGWFLEILFVYMAIFIFSIELLFSSQIALKGSYFGEAIRKQTYKSLYTVGAPISILSIILFVTQYLSSILIIIYFFAYFIMASVIFILFLKIFEPISILIFIKLIDWWKNKKDKIKRINYSNFYYPIILAFVAVLIFLILNMVGFQPLFYNIFGDGEYIIDSAKFVPPVNPTLSDAILFDLMIIFNFIVIELLPIIIMTVLLAFIMKYLKSIFLGFITYIPVIIIFSIIFLFLNVPPLIYFSPEEYWITGQISFTTLFNFNFYTLRTAALNANLTGVLGALALPYLYTRYIFNIIIWTLIIFYSKKSFKSKNIQIDDKNVEKVIFSTIRDYISFNDYIQEQAQYLITKKKEAIKDQIEKEREEIKDLLDLLEEDKLLDELKPEEENERKRFYYTLKYLFFNKFIDIWKPEFKYIFERAEKQGLYLIYDDGRGVFDYAFRSDSVQDPGLVSGMFSAITSFVKEMTKSTEALKKIDHGDITILLEYGDKIFGALFIKGTQSSEIRAPLKEFVQKFEEKYSDILKDWTGSLVHFKDVENNKLVEDIFKEE
ncbi:MAG: hypothetical protein JSV23_09160 [Promethearchaeota archaeon]|nr:MAG: hypothetical protein JSV23_09160 [Candidatus Lokiarchaeota archaeon]